MFGEIKMFKQQSRIFFDFRIFFSDRPKKTLCFSDETPWRQNYARGFEKANRTVIATQVSM